jgi:transcriptional regulator with XRE-family HTH domain
MDPEYRLERLNPINWNKPWKPLQTRIHDEAIGDYERDEVKPSIEIAASIAEALKVSLDYLVGNTDILLEKNVVNKIVDIQKLNSEDRAHVFDLLDAFRQSHKAKKVLAGYNLRIVSRKH